VTASPPDDWAERFVAIEPRKTTDLEAKEQSGDGSHRYAVGAVTDSCIRAMRVLRERRGWSALHLSRLVEEQAGVYLPRSVITNLENGRRRDMSVEQLGDTACGKCNDAPPEGYACLTCGAH
jgi:hypothetical protein